MTRFAHLKKSREAEPFVSFLPRLTAEPGLVLNFSATALRNVVVRPLRLLTSFVIDTLALGFFKILSPSTLRILFQNQNKFKFILSDTHVLAVRCLVGRYQKNNRIRNNSKQTQSAKIEYVSCISCTMQILIS